MNRRPSRPDEITITMPEIGSSWAVIDRRTGIAELRWLFVEFRHRGAGHGSNLLRSIELRLLEQDVREIHAVADAIDGSVASAEYIPQLVSWYERRGYVHLGDQRLTKRLRV